MSLKEWFGKGPKGDWVDIGAPKKKGNIKLVDASLPRRANVVIQNAYQGQRRNQ
jgi:hypothetical protein